MSLWRYICPWLPLLSVAVAQFGILSREVAAQPDAPVRKNLLENGRFEGGEAERPATGWRIWGDGGSDAAKRITLDASEPQEGKYSLRIEHPSGIHAFVVSDPKKAIQTRKGKAYLISFWARTENDQQPGVFYLEAFSSIKPYQNVASPLRRPIEPSKEWRQYRFQVDEGKDFVAEEARYLLLAFRATREVAASQTLWIDDVSISEIPSTAEPLPTLRDLPYQPVNHRLQRGDTLRVELDPTKILGPATRLAGGISFHRIAGWGRHPHDESGKRVLEPELIQAISNLKLPMTRFYGVGDHNFSVETAIDKIVTLCRECGIPEQWTVLELEPHTADRAFGPEFYKRAITYCQRQGYRLRHWEICNEPYTRKSTAFENPDQYVTHVKEVAEKIRSIQPEAQVGVGIYSMSQPWGTYVLKQAAGHYDFVVGHYYDGSSPYTSRLEQITLGSNYAMLDHINNVNAMIRRFNPDRQVYQLDTEWGQSGEAAPGNSTASRYWRNANIVGTLHRAVRLIYYAREGMLRGASGWEMFARTKNVTFGHLTRDDPEGRLLLYWLYYYFNRHCGDQVLDVQGFAPWYDGVQSHESGPMTPVFASRSKERDEIYLVIVNGSWNDSYPAVVSLGRDHPGEVVARCLSQASMDANPLIKHEADAVRDLAVDVRGAELRFTLPAHSVVFLTVRD